MNPAAQRLAKLRQTMREHNLAAWIVPSADPHLSEYLPEHWQAPELLHFHCRCDASEKAERLRELGSLDNIAQIDIHTPTLDEVYAEFLKREDI